MEAVEKRPVTNDAEEEKKEEPKPKEDTVKEPVSKKKKTAQSDDECKFFPGSLFFLNAQYSERVFTFSC